MMYPCPTAKANARPFAQSSASLPYDGGKLAKSGTVYTLVWGSEFNKLAPQMPEGLNAPARDSLSQHTWSRAPPLRKALARYWSAFAEAYKFRIDCIYKEKNIV